MGLIFFGWTAAVAVRRQRSDDEQQGHAQLDALGFD
jgi:hypothetical protein